MFNKKGRKNMNKQLDTHNDSLNQDYYNYTSYRSSKYNVSEISDWVHKLRMRIDTQTHEYPPVVLNLEMICGILSAGISREPGFAGELNDCIHIIADSINTYMDDHDIEKVTEEVDNVLERLDDIKIDLENRMEDLSC